MHKSEWYNLLPTQADNTRLNKVLSADAAPKLPFRQVLLISKKKRWQESACIFSVLTFISMQWKIQFLSLPSSFQRGELLVTWRSRGTLYCEDDICQDRRVKEQPERSTVQPLYLVRLAVLQTVYLQIKLSTKAIMYSCPQKEKKKSDYKTSFMWGNQATVFHHLFYLILPNSILHICYSATLLIISAPGPIHF